MVSEQLVTSGGVVLGASWCLAREARMGSLTLRCRELRCPQSLECVAELQLLLLVGMSCRSAAW